MIAASCIRATTWVALICTAFSTAAQAATINATMNASMTIPATCTISVPATIDFGSATVTATGSLSQIDISFNQSLVCTNGSQWQIYQSSLNGSGLNFLMKSGSNAIAYMTGWASDVPNYRWPNTPPRAGVHTQSGSAEDNTRYARVPAQSSVPPGNDTDTLTIGIVF